MERVAPSHRRSGSRRDSSRVTERKHRLDLQSIRRQPHGWRMGAPDQDHKESSFWLNGTIWPLLRLGFVPNTHVEVDAIINSRPLTTVSGEPGDLEPLTPNHILTTKSTVILPPPGKFQQNDVCKSILVPMEEGISSSNARKKQMAKSSTKPGRRRYCTDSRRECPT